MTLAPATDTAILEALLSAEPVLAADLPEWWQRSAGARHAALGIDRALLAGVTADRLGFAFAGGYDAALRALFTGLDPVPTCLCASEEGGNHPRAIQTRLEPRGQGFVLDGEKRWATLGPLAEQALVVAKTGEREGKSQLVVVRVALPGQGIEVAAMPETPFVPEVPHATIRFRDAAVEASQVLPGDGYARYLKPFRSIEDLHVHAALLGYLLGVARRSGWPASRVERLLALVGSARDLRDRDPLAPATHLALAGLLAETEAFVQDAEPLWAQVDAAEARRWERDRPLLSVAGKARQARQKRAREHFGLPE